MTFYTFKKQILNQKHSQAVVIYSTIMISFKIIVLVIVAGEDRRIHHGINLARNAIQAAGRAILDVAYWILTL